MLKRHTKLLEAKKKRRTAKVGSRGAGRILPKVEEDERG